MATRQMQKKVVTEDRDEEKVTKREFSQSDGVSCVSITHGILNVLGPKTNMIYRFSDYGDVTEIEYRDLVAMVRSKDNNIYEPRFVVEDEDFIAEYPAIKKFYNDEFSLQNIKEILSLPDSQMAAEIKKLPRGALDSLKSIAAEQVATGEIDSVRKIRTLDSIFGTDLNLIGELFLGQ